MSSERRGLGRKVLTALLLLVSLLAIVLGYINFVPAPTLTLKDLSLSDQREAYNEVLPENSVLVEHRLEGFEEAYRQFVVAPNVKHARAVGKRTELNSLLDPDQWDRTLFKYIVASFEVHARSPKARKRLATVRRNYLDVLTQLRGAGYPDVFAAVPYFESRYRSQATSRKCALGWWQFMPEYGHRARTYYGMNFRVDACPIRNADLSTTLWTSPRSTPVMPVTKSVYIGHRRNGTVYCKINNPAYGGRGVCHNDDRIDLTKSTEMALRDFQAPWRDQALAASGAAVQITLLSHNAGWDASLFGARTKRSNLNSAFTRWKQRVSGKDLHRFYGDNLNCRRKEDKSRCSKKSVLLPSVQHYAYPIIAEHFLAACIYGKFYAAESDLFKEYRDLFTGAGHYCARLAIPNPMGTGTPP